MVPRINLRGLGVFGVTALPVFAMLLGACASSVRPSGSTVLQTREVTRRIEIHAPKPAVLSVAREVLKGEGGQVIEDSGIEGAQATFPATSPYWSASRQRSPWRESRFVARAATPALMSRIS